MPRRDESGLVTYQLLAVMPVLALMLALPLRAALSGWVNLSARHAANEAADEAASFGGTDDRAVAIGEARLRALAPRSILAGPASVTVDRSASRVRVTVSTGMCYTFLGLFSTTSASVYEPVQRFVGPDEK